MRCELASESTLRNAVQNNINSRFLVAAGEDRQKYRYNMCLAVSMQRLIRVLSLISIDININININII